MSLTGWTPENVARRIIWKLRKGHSLTLEEIGFDGASTAVIAYGLHLTTEGGYIEAATTIGETTLYKLTGKGREIADFMRAGRQALYALRNGEAA